MQYLVEVQISHSLSSPHHKEARIFSFQKSHLLHIYVEIIRLKYFPIVEFHQTYFIKINTWASQNAINKKLFFFFNERMILPDKLINGKSNVSIKLEHMEGHEGVSLTIKNRLNYSSNNLSIINHQLSNWH